MKPHLLISAVTVFFVLSSCGGVSEETDGGAQASAWVPDERAAIAVEVLEITEGSLIPLIEASGVIQGMYEADIIPETSGRIRAVEASLGQEVKKGDLLFLVEDDIPLLNRDLARQQYETVSTDFDAIESSYKKGGVSRSDYNNARSRLLQIKTSYETAKRAFENTRVRSPIDGTISSLSTQISVGNYVNPGIKAGRIADTSRLMMEISLGERQVRLVEPGMTARIQTARPAYTVDAVVTAVGTGADPSTASFPVRLEWENTNGVFGYSGIGARVTIPVQGRPGELVIPTSAIVNRDRKQAVFIEKDNRSELRFIETGEILGGRTLVVSGIAAGERLIISALSALGDGYPVKATLAGSTGSWK